MNGHDVLAAARRQLEDFVSTHKPPELSPLGISPWMAMSLLQKAIRRGEEQYALRAAATLLRSAPDRLWRRCSVIAFEDVGIADLETASIVTAAMGGKRYRAELGGEWRVASRIVSQMVQARKCRAADDLLLVAEQHPAHQRARDELAAFGTRELVEVVCSDAPLPERALALWYALGTDRRPSLRLQRRKGEPSAVFDALCEAGLPHSVVEIAREGFRKTGEVLGPFVALLSAAPPETTCRTRHDDVPPAVMIGETPSYAFDLYSREGRAAFGKFLQGASDTACWVRAHIPPSQRVNFLGGIVFRLEGGLCARRLHWPTAVELRWLVDAECHGPHCPDATELLQIVRNDLDLLNKVRLHVCVLNAFQASREHQYPRY